MTKKIKLNVIKFIFSGSTTFIFKILRCLHGYLSPTSKSIRKDHNGKKETIRHTLNDSQESFAFIEKSMRQLEDHINHIKSRQETQFGKFFGVFRWYEITVYKFSALYRYMFKTFHIFNLEYALACVQFWVLNYIFITYLKKYQQHPKYALF